MDTKDFYNRTLKRFLCKSYKLGRKRTKTLSQVLDKHSICTASPSVVQNHKIPMRGEFTGEKGNTARETKFLPFLNPNFLICKMRDLFHEAAVRIKGPVPLRPDRGTRHEAAVPADRDQDTG